MIECYVYILLLTMIETAAFISRIPCGLFNLRRAARVVTQLYDDVMRPTGLKGTQFALLSVVRELGPIPVSELGEAMGMDRTTVTRNVRLLEREELVHVEPGQDRRTRLVRLTPFGRSAHRKAIPYWEEAQAALVGRLGEPRWKRLRGELATIVELSQQELQTRVRE